MDRKKYSRQLKARTVIDAIKDQKPIPELESKYGFPANQIRRDVIKAMNG